jgi:large subunit ribosomal protein L4
MATAATASSSKLVTNTQPVYVTLSQLIVPNGDETKSAKVPEVVAELDPTVFSHPIRRDILHLCVVHHLDGLRQGTASTKTRGEVRGSGHKIRPQKGSGRARLGDGQSPMLRGGGVAFGPKPRDFSTKLPRKVIQMGMRVALSAKLRESSLGVVESLEWPGTKTKEFAARIDALGWRKTLFVTGKSEVPRGLTLSSRNLQKLRAITVDELNVYELVRWHRVVMDLAAVQLLEHKLSKGQPLALDASEEALVAEVTKDNVNAEAVETLSV